ncbi:MAG: hydrogenase formation protein HypD [Thermodesulfobacteriota bacterium]
MMSLKYIREYRDGTLAKGLLGEIERLGVKDCNFMEVCGTHTMSIFRYGIKNVLPDSIRLMTGPGCPVCVTAQKDIDAFITFARDKEFIVSTFGDLMKVPGSSSSLQREKSQGADVRIVYSVFDSLNIAYENPEKQVVFCAVGFETTTPTVAATILAALEKKCANFSIYSAHKLTPPALAALMETDGVKIDGFILPGHVSVITGTQGYADVFEKYGIPSVIAGFEPVDILKAVLMLSKQVKAGRPVLENAYERAVLPEGNIRARQVMDQVFTVENSVWRGIGEIPDSGMVLKDEYRAFDAAEKFGMEVKEAKEPAGCACGAILMGLQTPEECRLYNTACTPEHPVGPCMVSSEGACAAYYKYKR